jgi:hypothetical protein
LRAADEHPGCIKPKDTGGTGPGGIKSGRDTGNSPFDVLIAFSQHRAMSNQRNSHSMLIAFSLVCLASLSHAQDSYEIQVYGSETMAPGRTMVELHSNYTIQGQRETVNGVDPSYHALHETLELTYGINSWFETGFYVFSSLQEHGGWQWVGDHIRPRVRVPEEWHWPVGLSLSMEAGYQERKFSEDTWTLELRPIIDKQWGRWYFAFNPALEKSLDGENVNEGVGFSPSAKISLDLTKKVTFGVEYYASLGTLTRLSSWNEQQQQVFPVIDLNLSPNWEINFGVGFGFSRDTDDLIVKLILGRRF